MFTKFRDVPEDQIDAVIDGFSERDWIHIEEGYLRVAIHELEDWWQPMLGLAAGVDVGVLFCNLYARSLQRDQGV